MPFIADGWIAIALGVAIVRGALRRRPNLTFLSGIGAAIFVAVEFSDVSSLAFASVGNGIWLMAAAVAAICAALYMRRDAEEQRFADEFLSPPDAEDSELIES